MLCPDLAPRSAPPPASNPELVALREAIAGELSKRPTLPKPGGGQTLARWRALADAAAHDLCVVKAVEAHHDAAAILVDLNAHPPAPGELWAVWAAEPPGTVLEYAPSGPVGGTLSGSKAWCSGAEFVTHALVTARTGEERVLVRVALDHRGVSAPQTQWAAVGMSRIVSGALTFTSVPARQLGSAGAYLARPGFWHGGAGIAACWFGGAVAVADALRVHPCIASSAHAAVHLGAIDMQLGAAAALLRELAARIDADPLDAHKEGVIRVRSFVERAATDIVDRVGRALGPGPLCADRSHAQRCADLTTFLRQSHAERDWQALGQAVSQRVSAWAL